MIQKRILCNTEIRPMGFGCWAIGGPWTINGRPAGWGEVDNKDSIRALHCAFDLGITLYDTAANYGAGHSEHIVGKAFKERREKVLIATKFGYKVDPVQKAVSFYGEVIDSDEVAQHIKTDCELSLKRLATDYIDLFQFHINGYPSEKAGPILEILEELVLEGKIRYYGWSTDSIASAETFLRGPHCAAIQHQLNMFQRADEMLALCTKHNIASINRGPLAHGLLTGKYTVSSKFSEHDFRSSDRFHKNKTEKILPELEKVKSIITAEGRSLTQGALSWIWSSSDITIPIPGMRTVEQVHENCKALDYNLFDTEQMQEIDSLFLPE